MREITVGDKVVVRHVGGMMQAAGIERGKEYKVARIDLQNKRHIVRLEGLEGIKLRFNQVARVGEAPVSETSNTAVPTESKQVKRVRAVSSQSAPSDFMSLLRDLSTKHGAGVTVCNGVFEVAVGGLTFHPKDEKDVSSIYAALSLAATA